MAEKSGLFAVGRRWYNGSKAEKAYEFKNDGINIIILEDEKNIEDFLKIESEE